jgi:hypothetical protein
MAKTSSVLLALVVCVRAPAGEEPKGAVDTSFAVPTGRPILCTRTMRLDGAMEVTSEAGDQEVAMALEEEIRFIDEYSVLTRDREEATRFFVRAESKANGEINDPPLGGIEVSFTRDSEGVRLLIKNDRTLPQEMIEDLLEASDSAGIWLQFPAEGKIGESYKVDLAPLGPVLLSGELPVTAATSNLKLEAFDEAAGLATFRGQAELAEAGKAEDMEISSRYTGQCTIRVKPLEQRILSLSLEGEYRFEGKGSFHAKGKGTYRVELATEIGEAVKKARREKPRFRDRVHVAKQFGVKLTLPAHYARRPAEKEQQRYVRTLDSGKGIAVVVFQAVRGDTSKPQAFYDSVAASVRKEDRSAKLEKVKSPLGAGFACVAMDHDAEGGPFRVRTEIYPMGPVFLLYKLMAAPKAYAAAEKEFVKARASLKAAR